MSICSNSNKQRPIEQILYVKAISKIEFGCVFLSRRILLLNSKLFLEATCLFNRFLEKYILQMLTHLPNNLCSNIKKNLLSRHYDETNFHVLVKMFSFFCNLNYSKIVIKHTIIWEYRWSNHMKQCTIGSPIFSVRSMYGDVLCTCGVSNEKNWLKFFNPYESILVNFSQTEIIYLTSKCQHFSLFFLQISN